MAFRHEVAQIILVFSCSILLLSCASGPQPGSPETGYVISGFIGESPTVAAPSVTVDLLNADTGEVITQVKTNFFGKYSIKKMPAGTYIVQVRDIQWEVVLQDRNRRLDIDLSSPDGAMNYAGHQIKQVLSEKKETPANESAGQSPVGSTGPNDAQLAQQIAGTWWGYSGSTERKIGLCPDGSYYDSRESGYSGTSHDSGGNETMAWGTANQSGGSGRWTIQGNGEQGTITVIYNTGNQVTRTV